MNRIQTTTLGLAIAMTFPAAAQTLEQAVAFTLESNPEIKSAYNEYVSKR
ncbi:agglutination protein, partial [Vibrio cyclitrophicus]